MSALIIGVGDEMRGDDGVGPAVMAALSERREELPGGVEVRNIRGDSTQLLEMWAGVERAIVVDAVCSGAARGTVLRLEAADIGKDLFPRASTHTLSVAETLELGVTLGQVPKHLVLFGVEGDRFDTGAPLSPEVRSAIPGVISMILEELKRSAGGEDA
jgi:hydrogenase maturation protease